MKTQVMMLDFPYPQVVDTLAHDATEADLKARLKDWMQEGDVLSRRVAENGAIGLFICPQGGDPTDIFGRIIP